MSDIATVVILLVAFAFAVMMHVAITVGLAKRSPMWHAWVAFLVPPLAPYWAWRKQMRTRTVLWMGSILVYLAALLLSSRGT